MNPLQVLVVDDEAPARLRLAQLLAQCCEPGARVVAEAGDAETALQAARQHRPELALLDIGLPGRSGLLLAQALKAQCPGLAVAFVTAHAQHAVHAFELEAVDYLTKPVRLERLQHTLRRVAAARAAAQATAAPEPPHLLVQERGRLLRLPVAEVLYLRAELKYVTVRTAQAEHVLDAALGELAAGLGPGFLRIHRNAVVARAAVRALERRDGGAEGDGWAVCVAPVNEWLAVSRRQLQAVREALRAAP